MGSQLSAQIEKGQQQQLAALTAMQQILTQQQLQISGLNDRLVANDEKTEVVEDTLQKTGGGLQDLEDRVKALEQQLQASVVPMQQQLARLEQRPWASTSRPARP